MLITLVRERTAQAARMHLTIPDIHCWECADLLELAIESHPGVESAPVYLSGHCVVTFRPNEASPSQLVATINARGYDVQDVEVEGVEARTLSPMQAPQGEP